MKPITENTLFYGDNLKILREYIPDESVDLIYLDPPFNSNRNYNVLFRDESGEHSTSQITAFEDTWQWDRSAEDAYHKLVTDAPERTGRMIGALRDFIGENQMMAYLVMMNIRLIELHRVLKPTGSLYLHCDPTASHYLKIVMDVIFGKENFINEIVWCYKLGGRPKKGWPKKHDTILFYVKDFERFNFYPDPVRIPYESTGGYISSGRKIVNGKEYKVNPLGKVPEDWWFISALNRQSSERLGYPTQKPLSLLERILAASSKESDWILDPFAGCGTTIAAAEKLNRKWIGIDITHLAISLLKNRLWTMQQEVKAVKIGKNYVVIGEPEDLTGARQLAKDDPYQFQWWANGLIEAKPIGGELGSKKGKKGADRGIDGVISFIDDDTGKPKRVIVQVKSGNVKSGDIRDLVGTVEREKAAIGVFITLNEPTKDMKKEAISAGYYFSEGWNQNYPKIQILTIEELLNGAKVDMPPMNITFKKARIEKKNGFEQNGLSL
jgi:site-specific DNA-methyltransferase (adenine-specific)